MATDPAQLIYGMLKSAGLGQTVSDFQTQDAQNQNLNLHNQQMQGQMNAAQAEQQRMQAFQGALNGFGADPSDANLARIAQQFPEQIDTLKKQKQLLDAPVLQSQRTYFSGLERVAGAGNTKLVTQQLQQMITAEKAQGHDTSEAEDMLARVGTGDSTAIKQVQAFAKGQLYHLDPEYAKSIDAAAKVGADEYTSTSDGVIYSKRTSEITRVPQQKVEYKTLRNGDGSQSLVQVGGGDPASNATGTPAAPNGSGAKASRWSSAKLAEDVPFGGKVTSGQRSVGHNKAIGGAPNSQHVSGTAIDVVFPKGVTTEQVQQYYADKGANVRVIHENAGDQYSTGDHFHIQGAGAPPSTSQAKFNGSGTKVLYTSKAAPSGGRGNAPSGYRYKGDGTLEPIPGGPADSEKLDQRTIDTMAEQYLSGDKTVLQGLGRGKQGGQTIAQVRAAISRKAQAAGMSGRDIAAQMADFSGVMASERSTGTRIAAIEIAATEAQKLAPLAVAASDALPRAGWTPFAKAEQAVRNGTNDVRLRRFVTANNGLVNTYARAVSPSGAPTVSDKEHARELLNTAMDQRSYRAVVDQMMKEIEQAKAAPRQVRNELRQNVGGNYRGGGAAMPRTATNPKTGQKMMLQGNRWVPFQ